MYNKINILVTLKRNYNKPGQAHSSMITGMPRATKAAQLKKLLLVFLAIANVRKSSRSV